MTAVRCFFLEPTENVAIWLRRYTQSYMDETLDKCALPENYGTHQNWTRIENRPVIWKFDEVYERDYIDSQEHSSDDPRWPVRCACGYTFVEADVRQVFQELIYSRSDNGELLTLRDHVAGMMWDAWWMGKHWRGADGLALTVKLPGNFDWVIDGPSSDGNGQIKNERGWTRSGTPPLVTARPSIRVPGKDGQPDRYHGWLTDGELTPC